MSNKKTYKGKHQGGAKAKVVTGTLDITRSGMGFVIVQGTSSDIMVRPADFNTALHGDTVRVMVKGESMGRNRQQGEVMEVLSRKQLDFPGKLQISENFAFFVADVEKPMPDIFVPLDQINGATEKDMV